MNKRILFRLPSIILYILMIVFILLRDADILRIFFLEFISLFGMLSIILIANKKTGFISRKQYSTAVFWLILLFSVFLAFCIALVDDRTNNIVLTFNNIYLFGYFLLSLIVRFIVLKYAKSGDIFDKQTAEWGYMIISMGLSSGLAAFLHIINPLIQLPSFLIGLIVYYSIIAIFPIVVDTMEGKSSKELDI